jgi:hypothetical protein
MAVLNETVSSQRESFGGYPVGRILPLALRAKASCLVVWGSAGRGRGNPYRHAGVTAPVQRGVRQGSRKEMGTFFRQGELLSSKV